MWNTQCLKDCELDRSSSIPLHKQIRTKLESRIREKILHPHDRLPTIREMAEVFHVGPGTVMQALKTMSRDGTVVAKQGSGTFVAPERPRTIAMCFPFGKSRQDDPTFMLGQQFVDGLREGCKRGRDIHVFGSTENLSEEDIWKICKIGNAMGLVFHGMTPPLLRTMAAVSERLPVVGVLQDPSDQESASLVDCILCDPTQAITSEIEKRIRNGQRNFAYLEIENTLGIKNKSNVRWTIYDTARSVLREAGLRLQEHSISWKTYSLWERANADPADTPVIPDGTTLIASTPHLAGALLALSPRIGMDAISSCSSRYTLRTCSQGMTILYASMDAAAAEAARHIEKLIESGKRSSGERIFLHPKNVVSPGEKID